MVATVSTVASSRRGLIVSSSSCIFATSSAVFSNWRRRRHNPHQHSNSSIKKHTVKKSYFEVYELEQTFIIDLQCYTKTGIVHGLISITLPCPNQSSCDSYSWLTHQFSSLSVYWICQAVPDMTLGWRNCDETSRPKSVWIGQPLTDGRWHTYQPYLHHRTDNKLWSRHNDAD